ncbi:MAG: 4Fe-4S binding protein [Spirochaetales bacterium]|uniref:4Fe-4S binding protein n=1 Tax=Candidatus Thalassospirochaeta sargassi TaxID=3119039 RepID=A0AAJ1IE66_9SPIO|nr:4Fe-4S binding protein [Spirochaetales bacterium]
MKKLQLRQRVRKTMQFTAFLLFPATYYYFSPYLPFQALTEGVVNGSIFIFGALFVGSIFFGRTFCGWFCPAGGLQDCVMQFRPEPVKRRRVRWIKFLLWGLWLSLYVFLIISAGKPDKTDFFFLTESGFSVSDPGSLILYLIVVFLLFVFPLLIGRRASCHIICWMAPFMIIGRKLGNAARLPGMGLVIENDNCISCNGCTSVCPMSIDVMANVSSGNLEDQDCILCGACADACPKGVIALRIGRR